MVGADKPRMLKLTAQYADLWNTGYMGKPETLADRRAKNRSCVPRDQARPRDLGVTALIGLWYPDLQANKPKFFDNPLTGSVQEIAAAMRGYAEIGVQHIMSRSSPTLQKRARQLTEALHLYSPHATAVNAVLF